MKQGKSGSLNFFESEAGNTCIVFIGREMCQKTNIHESVRLAFFPKIPLLSAHSFSFNIDWCTVYSVCVAHLSQFAFLIARVLQFIDYKEDQSPVSVHVCGNSVCINWILRLLKPCAKLWQSIHRSPSLLVYCSTSTSSQSLCLYVSFLYGLGPVLIY